jgi:LuxR family maltose regulon positive regulatory protein
LIARLNAGLQTLPGVMLISAPLGFGKTTLLSEWVQQRSDEFRMMNDESVNSASIHRSSFILHPSRVAWLSLDESDNEPRRFVAYCLAALQAIQPGVGRDILAGVDQLYLHPAPPEPLLTGLINEIAAIREPFVFVFDDYHVIKSRLIHEGIAFLLNNLPPQVYLIIASRTAPPLPLSRLRGRGQLTELHAADLSFTPAETAQFLNQVMGLTLSLEEISLLEARTEGWIAGLQMAALSMQGLRDTASFIKAFTGTHRYILDYLLEEVLQRQPAEVQQFLLQTSILTRLTGPLCEAVMGNKSGSSGETPSQHMLKRLEQNNLFIIPLDDERRWYRYHQLFADLLYDRLEQATSRGASPLAGERLTEVAELHRRASDWYEEQGFMAEAMHHALAALDTERVVRLVRQKAGILLSRSELIALLSWLDHLPQELVRSRSRVALLSAWAMVLTGQVEAVEMHLQTVEQGLAAGSTDAARTEQANLRGEIAAIRAVVAYFRRDMAQVVALCRQALADLAPDHLFLRGVVLQSLGAACSWQGNVVEATQHFAAASAVSQATGNTQVTVIALWSQAQLWVEQGQLHRAAETYQRALQLLGISTEPTQTSHPSAASRIYIGLAELVYQRNDLEQADEYLRTGLQLGEAEQSSGALSNGYLLAARLKQARGDFEGALEAARLAARLARQYTGPYYWANEVAAYQSWLWLAQGNLRVAELWAQERELWPAPLPEPIPYLREGEYLVLARLLLAQGSQPAAQPADKTESLLALALTLVQRISQATQAAKRTGRLLEALTLQALILQAQDDKTQALTILSEALALAEPEDYIRLFVDEGSAMADLLRQAQTQKLFPHYLPRLLKALPSPAAPLPSPALAPLLDPLSEREIEILKLIAAGMSNQELANTLFLTVGTVKWHLNNIYSKLDARSRTQAIARARELRLI